MVEPGPEGQGLLPEGGGAFAEEGPEGGLDPLAVVLLAPVGPEGQASLVHVEDVAEVAQGRLEGLEVPPKPQEARSLPVGFQVVPVGAQPLRPRGMAGEAFRQGLHPLQIGRGGLEEVEAGLPGVAVLSRQVQPRPHLLHGPEVGAEGRREPLSLQVPGHLLPVEDPIPLPQGVAEDRLEAHPRVGGEDFLLQLAQQEVFEVGRNLLHGLLDGAQQAWRNPFHLLHGSSKRKTPTGFTGRSHQPQRAVQADSIALHPV